MPPQYVYREMTKLADAQEMAVLKKNQAYELEGEGATPVVWNQNRSRRGVAAAHKSCFSHASSLPCEPLVYNAHALDTEPTTIHERLSKL